MKTISHKQPGFRRAVAAAAAGLQKIEKSVMRAAEEIFDDVAQRGDRALFEYTSKFERHSVSARTIRVTAAEIKKPKAAISRSDLETIKLAARRIRAFHARQVQQGFLYNDGHGAIIEERIVPLDRAGLCIPGGRAPLASTVLMTAIPARLAGVREIVMISPWPEGRAHPAVLAAAEIAGVDSIYKMGGAQGVAALACGTASIPRVDKIVGPGSVWVTAAKAIAAARGLAGIDSLAGPSEIAIVADDSAQPEWTAWDLLSQVEHGADSSAALITTSEKLARDVNAALDRIMAAPRDGGPYAPAIRGNIRAFLVRDMNQAAEVANQLAPEHLEIIVKAPRKLIAKFKNAASVFVGNYSPVPAGDYMAGANHVLPTATSARFSSPLGVHDFVKRQSITELSREGLRRISEPVARFAEMEGLTAHAASARKRFSK